MYPKLESEKSRMTGAYPGHMFSLQELGSMQGGRSKQKAWKGGIAACERSDSRVSMEAGSYRTYPSVDAMDMRVKLLNVFQRDCSN